MVFAIPSPPSISLVVWHHAVQRGPSPAPPARRTSWHQHQLAGLRQTDRLGAAGTSSRIPALAPRSGTACSASLLCSDPYVAVQRQRHSRHPSRSRDRRDYSASPSEASLDKRRKVAARAAFHLLSRRPRILASVRRLNCSMMSAPAQKARAPRPGNIAPTPSSSLARTSACAISSAISRSPRVELLRPVQGDYGHAVFDVSYSMYAVIHTFPSGRYSRGSPRPRCAMMLRWISLLPA